MSIGSGYLPPSGSSGAYSKIQAETDWGVRLYNLSLASKSYIEIRGIVFDTRNNPIGTIASGSVY